MRRTLRGSMLYLLEIYLAVGFIGLFMLGSLAFGHDAPSGWSYPFECCSGYDCREVDGPDASTRQHDVQVIFIDGDYIISTTGERIPEFDAKVKDSPDQGYHWCSQGGKDDSPTICLFRPPNMF